jgi:NADH dehydrogenase (ubiquinone) Fe-S protein 3
MIKKNFKYLNELQNIIPLIISQSFKDENSIVLKSNYLLFSLNILKNHISYQYKLLSCISGIDLLNKNYRFSVSYDLLSLTFNTRLRVKTFVDEITYIPSSVPLFINANWWEREIWDMYGIYFDKHPDLRRILTDYGFEGYPMRKDFPLSGFIELRYDDSKKRIVAETVELTQEFRSFSFETPWH